MPNKHRVDSDAKEKAEAGGDGACGKWQACATGAEGKAAEAAAVPPVVAGEAPVGTDDDEALQGLAERVSEAKFQAQRRALAEQREKAGKAVGNEQEWRSSIRNLLIQSYK